MIRAAVPADVDGVMALQEAVAREGRWIPTEEVTPDRRERLRAGLEKRDELHLTEAVGRLVGSLSLHRYLGGVRKARHVVGLGC